MVKVCVGQKNTFNHQPFGCKEIHDRLHISNIHQPSLTLSIFVENVSLGGKYRIGYIVNFDHPVKVFVNVKVTYTNGPIRVFHFTSLSISTMPSQGISKLSIRPICGKRTAPLGVAASAKAIASSGVASTPMV